MNRGGKNKTLQIAAFRPFTIYHLLLTDKHIPTRNSATYKSLPRYFSYNDAMKSLYGASSAISCQLTKLLPCNAQADGSCCRALRGRSVKEVRREAGLDEPGGGA